MFENHTRSGVARYNLREAILVGVLAPFALISAVLVSWQGNAAERALERRLQGEIALLARAMAPSISQQLGSGHTRALAENLQALFSIQRVYGAAVYNARGELVIAAGAADADVRNSSIAATVVNSGERDGRYRRVEGERVYTYFTPLLDAGGRIQGLLQLNRERREIDANLDRLRRRTWLVWGLAVLFSAAATAWLYRRMVGARVTALLDGMQRFSDGERKLRLAPAAPREFGDIARRFNEMVGAVRRTELALRLRQRAERRLQRELRASERSAAVGHIAQGLAHELGSPLTVIDGRVRQLQRSLSDPKCSALLDEIREQVQRTSDIVRQLLNYARLQSIHRQQIDLHALLQRVCQDAGRQYPHISLHLQTPALQLVGDPLRLELALSNLIRNALRHARTAVQVSAVETQGLTRVSVDDDGPGVPAEDIPLLFEPFFSRQAGGEGSGLGLAIVHRVMQEHGGEARYRGGATGGSEFTLLFPRRCTSAADKT